MGLHHYKVSLLPRAYFGQHLPTALAEADIERGEDIVSGWWASHPPSARLHEGLRGLLATDQSWGETEEYVSDGDWTSDVRIWKDADRVWQITLRFSPVADGWPLMQRFLSLARDEQCLLFEQESGAVILPDENIVRERLAASRAMRFVRYPAGTTIDAAEELKDHLGDRHACMSEKIKMRDGDSMLIMVKDRAVIHFTPNMSLPHSEFVKRVTGELPPGAWVGTVSKLDGEVAAISSKHFFGYQLPAPDWVWTVVREKFE